MNQKEKSGQFVNDLLRTEFHKCASLFFDLPWSDGLPPRKFMAKFIKVSIAVSRMYVDRNAKRALYFAVIRRHFNDASIPSNLVHCIILYDQLPRDTST